MNDDLFIVITYDGQYETLPEEYVRKNERGGVKYFCKIPMHRISSDILHQPWLRNVKSELTQDPKATLWSDE